MSNSIPIILEHKNHYVILVSGISPTTGMYNVFDFNKMELVKVREVDIEQYKVVDCLNDECLQLIESRRIVRSENIKKDFSRVRYGSIVEVYVNSYVELGVCVGKVSVNEFQFIAFRTPKDPVKSIEIFDFVSFVQETRFMSLEKMKWYQKVHNAIFPGLKVREDCWHDSLIEAIVYEQQVDTVDGKQIYESKYDAFRNVFESLVEGNDSEYKMFLPHQLFLQLYVHMNQYFGPKIPS
jgi:hypothetical protein